MQTEAKKPFMQKLLQKNRDLVSENETLKRRIGELSENFGRPAPCEHRCESKAFEIEVRKLNADLAGARNCIEATMAIENDLRAENARLQSVIDEANAQEYSAIIREGGDSLWAEVSDKHNLKHGDVLYARPIPAQQSVDRQSIIDVLLASGNLSEGVTADLIISAIGAQPQHTILIGRDEWRSETHEQQSPAVAVPDAYVPIHTRSGEPLWANAVANLEQDHPSSYEMRPVYFNPSPRITEQELRDINEIKEGLESMIKIQAPIAKGWCEHNVLNMSPFIMIPHIEGLINNCSKLIAKLNGDQNGK